MQELRRNVCLAIAISSGLVLIFLTYVYFERTHNPEGNLKTMSIAPAQGLDDLSRKGFRQIASILIPLDGTQVATPPLKDLKRHDYRFVVSGTFNFEHNGRTYDALYAFRGGYRHLYLRWTPIYPLICSQDLTLHRYTFRLPTNPEGKSLAVGLDISKFVDDFMLRQSEVVQSLHGKLKLEVWEKPLAKGFGWEEALWLGFCMLLVSGGALVSLMKWKMEQNQLEPDLADHLTRIRHKRDAALRLIEEEEGKHVPLHKKLSNLCEASDALARQIQLLRRKLREGDRVTLADEIRRLELQLALVTDEEMRQELEETLAEKRKVYGLWEDMDKSHMRLLLRLQRIEAIMDSTRLQLEKVRLLETPGLETSSLHAEIDLELKTMEEVSRQLEEMAEAMREGK